MNQYQPADRVFQFRRSRTRPLGLSVLEFIGCLMALVGGVWLGAIYLGVDVRHVAYLALSETELIDKVPEQWRPVDADAKNTPSPAERAASVQNELAALRQEIKALRTNGPADAAASTQSDKSTSPANDAASANDLAQEATLIYWTRLHDIVHNQSALEKDAESAATEGNATKVAALKGRLSRVSAQAIEALPTANVDPAALRFGRALKAWYESGAEMYEQAVQIWESPARVQGGGQLGKAWDQAHLQHRNEGRLLNDQAAATRDALTRRFGDGFAPIAGL